MRLTSARIHERRPLHRRRLRLGSATALASLAVCVAACGGGDDDDAGSTSNGGIGGTLAFNVSSTNQPAWEELIGKFNEKYPDVKVRPQFVAGGSPDAAASLLTQLQGGSGPDIFVTFAGAAGPQAEVTLQKAGYVSDLSSSSWVGSLPEVVKDSVTIDGKVYMQPIGVALGSIIVNGDKFDELGLKPLATFADVITMCKTVRQKEPDLVPLSFGPRTTGYAAVVGAMFASNDVYGPDPEWNDKRAAGEVTFGDSEWTTALQKLVDMKDAGCFSPGVAGDDVPAMFQQIPAGKTLGGLGPTSVWGPVVTAAPDVNWRLFALPGTTEEQTRLMVRPNTGQALNAKSKNAATAKAFMDFVGQQDINEAFWKKAGNSEMAPTTFGSDTWPDLHEPLYALRDRQTIDPEFKWPTAGTSVALGNGMVGLMSGQKTVDQVLGDMDASWNK